MTGFTHPCTPTRTYIPLQNQILEQRTKGPYQPAVDRLLSWEVNNVSSQKPLEALVSPVFRIEPCNYQLHVHYGSFSAQIGLVGPGKVSGVKFKMSNKGCNVGRREIL